MTPAGFPHSDIPGSKTVCVSPRLIAAYHVLHRLLVPRHPPCALSSLTGISKVHSLCITQRLVFDCQRAIAAHPRHAITPHARGERVLSNGAIQDLSWPARPKANRPSLESGGDSGARTRSLRLAKPALSQLSYIPVSGERGSLATRSVGGPGWTRTTHLTLIRRAL
jgi:hypothetical protein